MRVNLLGFGLIQMLGEEGVGSTVCQCGRPGMKPSEYQQRLRISRARELPEFSRDSADWYDAESILESHTHRDPPLNCVAEPSVSDTIADCRASGQGFAALRDFDLANVRFGVKRTCTVVWRRSLRSLMTV